MMGDRRNPAKEMTMGQMKDAANANGISSATTSIPSLKRTLSGGAASSAGHPIGVGPPNLASHLGVGMNSIPSVLHANPSTGPPQMMRAVTSSGVYNRPGAAGGSNASSSRPGGSVASLSTGSAGGATSVPTMGSRSVTQSSTMQDWRMYLTIEERQAVRSKIRDAYSSRCMSYEDLLQVASAIEEELLHISAPSRLDYFKSGFEFENRVKLKKDQLQGQLAALDSKRRPNTSPPPSSSTNPSTNSSGDSPNSASESGTSSFSKKPRT